MNAKNKTKRTKTQKTYFLHAEELGNTRDITNSNDIYKNKEEALDSAVGGDMVYEVKIIKKYKVVDESIKLVEIK